MVELITGTLGLLNAQKGKIKYTFSYVMTYTIILQSLEKKSVCGCMVFGTLPFISLNEPSKKRAHGPMFFMAFFLQFSCLHLLKPL